MWQRKRVRVAEDVPDLDEQIRRLRGLVASFPRPETVGALVALLTARATLASMQDRDEDVLEDRRAAAGLLRGFDGETSPVDRATSLLVWMGLTSPERLAGNLDGALDSVRRAVVLTDRLVAEDAEMCAAYLVDLDRLRRDVQQAGRWADAVHVAQLASDLATRLVELDEHRFTSALGIALVNEAAARAAAGDPHAGAAVNEEAIRLLEGRPDRDGVLATALSNRARGQRRTGQWAEAVATEQRALEAVHASRPVSRDEVMRMNELFLTLVRSGRREEAEQTVTGAIEVARQLVTADPAQRSLLATLVGNHANILGELKRYDDALSASQEALALREQIAASSPSPASDAALAMVLNNHSAALAKVDRVSEAARAAARAVELRRAAAADGVPNSVALLANAINTHAEQLARLGDGELAVRLAEEARGLYAGLSAPGAKAMYLRSNAETRARALAVAGRHDDAVAAAREAVEIGRRAAAEAPGERRELARCLDFLADSLAKVGQGSEAEAARSEAAQLRAAESS